MDESGDVGARPPPPPPPPPPPLSVHSLRCMELDAAAEGGRSRCCCRVAARGRCCCWLEGGLHPLLLADIASLVWGGKAATSVSGAVPIRLFAGCGRRVSVLLSRVRLWCQCGLLLPTAPSDCCCPRPPPFLSRCACCWASGCPLTATCTERTRLGSRSPGARTAIGWGWTATAIHTQREEDTTSGGGARAPSSCASTVEGAEQRAGGEFGSEGRNSSGADGTSGGGGGGDGDTRRGENRAGTHTWQERSQDL